MTLRADSYSFNRVGWPFEIEALLGREQIVLNNSNIHKFIYHKKILITGAAGSIGSELASQILTFSPGELILVDRTESHLVALESQLIQQFGPIPNLNIQFADITDLDSINYIFKRFKPEIVYHTAALKHVPFVEKFPYQTVKVNISGTKILTDIASEMKVEKFIFVSTDKAVNPISVMGATKRFGEMIMQSRNQTNPSNTQFICARFGNVLGSSGSVVPVFHQQLFEKKALHVTHREVERFFMTPFEAGQLLLESGSAGADGHVFIFDMGNPVRIYDLAKKFIELMGFEPHIDVPIIITGLRPGEKLQEELSAPHNLLITSHHSKITVARLQNSSPINIDDYIALLEDKSLMGNPAKIIKILMLAIPEFRPAQTR